MVCVYQQNSLFSNLPTGNPKFPTQPLIQAIVQPFSSRAANTKTESTFDPLALALNGCSLTKSI